MRRTNYDAILVLGGGLREGGVLPPHARARFDLALATESGEPIAPLSAGTSHRPALLDSHGRLVYESTAGARYLVERGIPPQRIFCETTAYDTIGNAYFSRLQLTEPLAWRRLLVVTSQFHMPRTEAIFRWIYSLDTPAPYRLDFAASPDDGLGPAALSARLAREQASLHSVEQLREKLTSLRELANWLFTEHRAYQAIRQPPSGDSCALLESY